MSSAPGTRAATAVSGLTDESVIGDIFGHYCSLVYQAVLECINSSLLIIGDCVKPPGRMQSGIEVESRKMSRFVNELHVQSLLYRCTSTTCNLMNTLKLKRDINQSFNQSQAVEKNCFPSPSSPNRSSTRPFASQF